MNKVMRIGTMDTGNGRWASIYVRARYAEDELSITGVIGPTRHGNSLGGAGQIDMEFAHRDSKDDGNMRSRLVRPSDIRFAPEWTADLWLGLLDVWQEWHLNGLHPGCEHQRALGWEKDGYDRHPSEPCPECGYKYGTAWNKVEVPASVLRFIASLPDTDKEPAWC